MNYTASNDPNTMVPVAEMSAQSNGILMCAPVGSSGMIFSGVANVEFRRVPCKARGVHGDHNIRTAYFDIPVNAEHGTLLICSHPGCSGSGRRFRYCAVCDLPVAKRNFTKRHGHGIVKPSRSGGGVSNAVALPVGTKNTLAGTKHRRSVSYDTNEYFYQEKLQQMAKSMMPPPQPQPPTQAVTTAVPALSSPLSSTSTTCSVDSNTGIMKMQLNSTEFQWLALLHNRPPMEDTVAMNRWLENVLEVSEPMSVPSVTPPSWSSDAGKTQLSEGPVGSDSASVEPIAVDASSNNPSARSELQPNRAEASAAVAVAEIKSGLALAEAASSAADALTDRYDEGCLPPQKRQHSDQDKRFDALSEWSQKDIDKVLAL